MPLKVATVAIALAVVLSKPTSTAALMSLLDAFDTLFDGDAYDFNSYDHNDEQYDDDDVDVYTGAYTGGYSGRGGQLYHDELEADVADHAVDTSGADLALCSAMMLEGIEVCLLEEDPTTVGVSNACFGYSAHLGELQMFSTVCGSTSLGCNLQITAATVCPRCKNAVLEHLKVCRRLTEAAAMTRAAADPDDADAAPRLSNGGIAGIAIGSLSVLMIVVYAVSTGCTAATNGGNAQETEVERQPNPMYNKANPMFNQSANSYSNAAGGAVYAEVADVDASWQHTADLGRLVSDTGATAVGGAVYLTGGNDPCMQGAVYAVPDDELAPSAAAAAAAPAMGATYANTDADADADGGDDGGSSDSDHAVVETNTPTAATTAVAGGVSSSPQYETTAEAQAAQQAAAFAAGQQAGHLSEYEVLEPGGDNLPEPQFLVTRGST